MKKALRFVALAGILALTSWLSWSEEAHAAIRLCKNYQGRTCYPNPPGTNAYCFDEYGQQMRCYCQYSGTWVCYYL